MTRVYVGLGSNLQQPERQLTEALTSIDELAGVVINRYSSFYRSKPVGPQDQPEYINAVAELETGLTPLDLLDQLQAIETQQGRIRGQIRWGPRTLDLDLLLYGNQIIRNERLTVPHPEMQNRDFVLVPLNEIAPDLVIPGLGPLSKLVSILPSTGLVRLK